MPIVEPEILPDGDHDLETSLRVTEQVQLLPLLLLLFLLLACYVTNVAKRSI